MVNSLHVIGSRHSGGAERFYARLVNAMTESGHAPVAVLRKKSVVLRELLSTVPCHQVPMRGKWDFTTRRELDRIMAVLRPSIVQTYMGRATQLTRVAQTSDTVHIARLGGYYDLKCYRHADAWVGNTQGICNYLKENGMPEDRVFHISNFVDAPELMPQHKVDNMRRDLNIPDNAKIIVYVGRLHPVKGVDTLIEAFSQLPFSIQCHPLFLIMVGDGILKSPLQGRLRNQSVGRRIRWLGWQANPGPYYQMADLFVCPSHHEPLGNVILEAWAHGKPVLATRTQGACELIEHGRNGVLVPCGDAKAMREGMIEMIKAADHPVLRGMIELGKQRIQQQHSKRDIMQRYLDTYEHLLEHVRHRRRLSV